jgi:hypothetical protein
VARLLVTVEGTIVELVRLAAFAAARAAARAFPGGIVDVAWVRNVCA